MLSIDFSSLSTEQIISLADAELAAGLADWQKNIWNFISDWYRYPDKRVAVTSSGSTGAPKQILHSHQAMLASAAMTCEALALKPGDTALLCLPVTKISGMMMVVRCIYNKMKIYCVEPSLRPLSGLDLFSPSTLAKGPGGEDIDFASFTPAQFYEIMESDKAFETAQRLHKIILGGEEVRGAMSQRIRTMPNEVYATFGMTETISHIALKRLNCPATDKGYKVLPGISIHSNYTNCLVIEAPQLGQPHLETNDIIRIIGPGEFEWLGRKDNIINSGGIKINPEELEGQLAAQITSPFFISAVIDDRLGQKLVLVMQADKVNEEQLNNIRSSVHPLEKTHHPREILLIHQFARTETGKIKRRETLLQEILQRIEL